VVSALRAIGSGAVAFIHRFGSSLNDAKELLAYRHANGVSGLQGGWMALM
jgi:hypothetical protein